MKTCRALRLSLFSFLVALTSATLAHGAADYTTPYAVSTLAGTSSIGSQDGTGASARFFSPGDVATDAAGNFYVTDQGNHTIRKITPAGVVTTFAGAPGEPGSADGTVSAARFDGPQGIAADASGNLYVADTGNHTLRKITPAGVVTTLAGSAGLTGNADGTGNAARFNRPRRLAIDTTGNLYLTEAGNNAVRKITPTGTVTTFATDLAFPEASALNGETAASYGAITVDSAGNVYVAAHQFSETDSYLTETGYWWYTRHIGFVHQLPPAGGSGTRIWETSVYRYYDGSLTNAGVSALAIDATGQLIAVQGYQIMRNIAQTPGSYHFVVLAGDGTVGGVDGSATTAKFGNPLAIAYDRNGNLAIADTGNNVVRKLSTAGEVTTVAGLALERATGTTDGAGDAARFVGPTGTVVDAAGNAYVADTPAHVIRKITPGGTVTTLAGSPGESGTTDGVGAAARFNAPRGLALGADGALYVTDTNNHTIRRVALDGTTTTFAGLATATGWSDGPRLTARFMFPYGLCFDPAGNLYVTSAATVRRIAPDGEVTTLAGFNSETGYVDGTGIAARFTVPYGITADSAGNLYVTEAPSSPAIARIRKITPAGVVTTLAGAEQGYADGSLAAARFDVPSAITIDASNNLYVADYTNHVVRKISATGAVTTIAGLADAAGHVDDIGRTARFFYPAGIALDANGALYVTSGTTVRKASLATAPAITTQPASQSVAIGTDATFSVSASGTAPLSYQWHFNGTAIAGATSASYAVSSARAADAGDYTVVVSNGAGSVTSNKATLTVTSAPPPPASGGGTSGGGGGGAPSVWFAFAIAALAALRRFR